MEFIQLLRDRLADAIDLHVEAKQAYWMVKAAGDTEVSELLHRVAVEAHNWACLIAERTRQAQGPRRRAVAHGSRPATVKRFALPAGGSSAHLQATRDAVADFSRGIHEAADDVIALNDAGATDLFIEVSLRVDECLWMLDGHVQQAPAEAQEGTL